MYERNLTGALEILHRFTDHILPHLEQVQDVARVLKSTAANKNSVASSSDAKIPAAGGEGASSTGGVPAARPSGDEAAEEDLFFHPHQSEWSHEKKPPRFSLEQDLDLVQRYLQGVVVERNKFTLREDPFEEEEEDVSKTRGLEGFEPGLKSPPARAMANVPAKLRKYVSPWVP